MIDLGVHFTDSIKIERIELDINSTSKSILVKISLDGKYGSHSINIFGNAKDSWTEATKELVPRVIGETIIFENTETTPF